VSASQAAPTPPILLWLLRLLVVAPLACVTWVAANLLQNIPMWDEFDTVLKFLLDFRAADSLAGALREFFAMANEHCVLTSRLVFVLLYELTGKPTSYTSRLWEIFSCWRRCSWARVASREAGEPGGYGWR
jgi:hypothetical protein